MSINIRDARNLLGELVKHAPEGHFLKSLDVSPIKQGADGWNAAKIWPFWQAVADLSGSGHSAIQEVETWREFFSNGDMKTNVKYLIDQLKTLDWEGLLSGKVAAINPPAPETIKEPKEMTKEITKETLTPTPTGSTSAMKAMLQAAVASVEEAEKSSSTTQAEVEFLRQDLITLGQRFGKEIKDVAALVANTPATGGNVSAASIKGAVAQAIKDLSPNDTDMIAATKGARELPAIPQVSPYYVKPPWHDDVAGMMGAGMNGVIGGSSGAGKTFPLTQICADLGLPCKTISMTEDVTAETLVAQPKIAGGVSSFEDGALVHAMRHGYALIVDEGDSMRVGEALVYNYAIEYRTLTIPFTGEVVTAQNGFVVWFTSNSIGDETGAYNREGFDESLRQRLRCVIAHPMSLKEEIAILQKIVAPDGQSLTLDEATVLTKWAHAARPLHFGINGNDSVLRGLPSTRSLVMAAEGWLGFNSKTGETLTPLKSKHKDVRKALWYPFSSSCNSDEKQALSAVNLWIW
jgi:hypothetical protein